MGGLQHTVVTVCYEVGPSSLSGSLAGIFSELRAAVTSVNKSDTRLRGVYNSVDTGDIKQT